MPHGPIALVRPLTSELLSIASPTCQRTALPAHPALAIPTSIMQLRIPSAVALHRIVPLAAAPLRQYPASLTLKISFLLLSLSSRIAPLAAAPLRQYPASLTQKFHNIESNQIYRAELDKIKLQQLRQLYTNRATTFPYHWDVPVACGMLKAFISELPESILTQELHGQFEQTTAIAEPQRESAMRGLVATFPSTITY
ncbi:hypothetical protein ACJJTC_010048 [Scirpophaga incertulas]